MLRYHHLGIPTTESRPGERHLPEFGMHVSGYDTSSFRIEWMRFDPHSPMPDLVQQVPHVAFEVDDLAAALEGREVLIHPNSPSAGVLVAFVIMALTLSALYQVFSSGLRTAIVAEQYSTATQLAKSLLTEYATIRPFEAGEYNGQHEDTPYRWRTSITPIDTSSYAPAASEQFQAMEITVEVSWPSGVGNRSLSLRTLRLEARS